MAQVPTTCGLGLRIDLYSAVGSRANWSEPLNLKPFGSQCFVRGGGEVARR